ncbi:hypothetical protein N7494_000902 [Penicillium frequentans]|uniref:Uncharacterized protein n=1 Tax=Penicillium frequentans TaxID=3151616 RepID=A0AAD6D6T5_9EURO|nr:hypothetical protein N7494_000902 [Penicillium glabrum]
MPRIQWALTDVEKSIHKMVCAKEEGREGQPDEWMMEKLRKQSIYMKAEAQEVCGVNASTG